MSNVRKHLKHLLLALLLSTWLVGASAQTAVPRLERDPTAQTDSRKTVRESSGWLLVVAEDNLLDRLEASSVEHTSDTPSVSVGEPLLVVIFYANPGLRSDRTGDVKCDLKVIQPNGAVSTVETGVACFKGPLAVGEENLYLPGMIVRSTGEPTDPRASGKSM
jgi:hypothetical protein